MSQEKDKDSAATESSVSRPLSKQSSVSDLVRNYDTGARVTEDGQGQVGIGRFPATGD